MKQLTIEAKQMIVEKALTRKGKGVAEIAVQYNIGYSTLQKWIRESRAGTLISCEHKTVSGELSPAERFTHLVATSSLDDVKLGVYCREKGLYSFQLTQWKEEFMKQSERTKQPEHVLELKKLRAENKELKQDVRRKDRALAETTALLVLKKKADLIWGVSEDV
jgi:transposase